LIWVNARRALSADNFAMSDEFADTIRENIRRYRALLALQSDPDVRKVLVELIREAKAALDDAEGPD
jgi:hypothetical protein